MSDVSSRSILFLFGFLVACLRPLQASDKEAIDVHVHLAALPDATNGCWMSNRMRRNPVVRFVMWKKGLRMDRPAEANRSYLEQLARTLRDSKHVRRAVLLALDGAYDQKGNLDPKATSFLVSNDAMFSAVKQYPDVFLPGCSINPQRRDALAEVERCAERGAVLVKVLPNAQGFDPADPAYVPFYQSLKRHHLPMLCHVGREYSVSSARQSLGDPARLRRALDQGVTVIAAHGMSEGLFFREPYFSTLEAFVRKYPDFYWEASGMSLPNRVGMLLRLRRHPELQTRMVFGTDYPLPVFAYPVLLAGHLKGYLELRRLPNPFDRHYRMLEILGFRNPASLSLRQVLAWRNGPDLLLRT